MRNVITAMVVVAVGVTVLWAGTDGLRVLTAEGARRLAVSDSSRTLPDIPLVGHHGEAFRFADLRGRAVLVEFIYTRCVTICSQLGETFAAIQERTLNADVSLVSISFDPRDGTGELLEYAGRYDAVFPKWRVARVEDPAQLEDFLKFFAVTVVADGYGGFEHNAAVLVVDREGQLVEVVDDRPVDIPMEALWKRL